MRRRALLLAFDDDGAASGANRHDGLPVARLRWAPRDAEFTALHDQ